ncbi:MAG TPA: hypothetical protein VFB29_11405 [Pseudolabrys sp.]|nr:hypothetical protein [Pseudolabrys sp.]
MIEQVSGAGHRRIRGPEFVPWIGTIATWLTLLPQAALAPQ